jgi:predicted metal-dependent peptidase
MGSADRPGHDMLNSPRPDRFHEAQELLATNKVWLQRHLPLIGSELLRVDVVVIDHRNVATAATDGQVILFNPNFTVELSNLEVGTNPRKRFVAAVMLHELIHIAFNHHDRRGCRDPALWNCAADFVTNLLVMELGLELPPGSLFDAEHSGKSVEDVYACLEQDPRRARKAMNARHASQRADGHLDVDHVRRLLGTRTEASTSTPLSQSTIGSIRQALLAQPRRNSAGIAAEQLAVKALHRPAPRWREVLSQWCSGIARVGTSFSRPNRRLLGQGLIMPGASDPSLDGLIIGLDSSGSRWDRTVLRKVIGQIEAVRSVIGCRLRVITFDHEIRQQRSFEGFEAISGGISIAGGGGTDFRCLFAEVERIRHDHAWQLAPVIVITDAMGIMPTDPVDRTCWLIPSAFPALVPFGMVVRYDESDAPRPPAT